MIEAPLKVESSLTDQVDIPAELKAEAKIADEHAWIEVIQRMDDIYADLVRYQVDLEDKNSQLEEAQSFIQSVISSMSEILIVGDIKGNILQVNQALIDNIGISESEIKDKTLTSLFSNRDLPVVGNITENIRSGSLIDCEVDLINADQQLVPMAINCSARFDGDNRLSGFVITGRPLGELRKAYSELHRAHEDLKTTQKHLIQSEKMATLGRLVAGVAHELNNPISFLFGNMHALNAYQGKFKTYLGAIHSNASQEEQQRLREELRIDHMLGDIAPLIEGSLEGAERISDIVQNLQGFATPQESKMQSFDLINVVKRASSWVLKATTKISEVKTHHPEQLEMVNNEGYVHQILVNLIQNAVDATEHCRHPQIEIFIEQKNDNAIIRIIDNGHGIEEADLVKVFDPFFTTKEVGSGTGLGLYICYGLASEQCQGDLSVQNADGGGAEFILSLPLQVRK